MPRPRRRSLTLLLSTIVAALVLGSAAPAAIAADTSPSIRAVLSATEGPSGAPLSLDLGVVGATDLYAATVRIRYDADRVALDPGAVTSEFPGMFSVSGVEGAVDFTVTRLGTSSGRTGDLSLGSLGFVAKSAGEALLRVDEVSIVDSALASTTLAPAIGLTYTVAPSSEAPVPTTPGVSVTGYGSGVPRAGDTTFRGSAPQSSAAPTATPPRISSSSLDPRAGDTVTLTVRGLTPDAAHRVELHSDPFLLGEATADGTGSFVLEATIPAAAPPGEHEIVVVSKGFPVATLPITIREADGATTAPQVGATPSPGGADAESSGAADAAIAPVGSPAGVVWVLVALVVLLVVVAIVAMRRRTRRAADDEGRGA